MPNLKNDKQENHISRLQSSKYLQLLLVPCCFIQFQTTILLDWECPVRDSHSIEPDPAFNLFYVLKNADVSYVLELCDTFYVAPVFTMFLKLRPWSLLKCSHDNNFKNVSKGCVLLTILPYCCSQFPYPIILNTWWKCRRIQVGFWLNEHFFVLLLCRKFNRGLFLHRSSSYLFMNLLDIVETSIGQETEQHHPTLTL